MSEHVPAPRRYDEEEVARLLERSTELQRSSEAAGGTGAGLTLRELEQIAAEAGIDPRHLRRAASELEADRGPRSPWEAVLGAPTRTVIERTVPVELSTAAFEGLVHLIAAGTRGQGSASVLGRSLTWTSRSDTDTTSQQVTVSVRDGETVIRAEERLSGLAGAWFGGLMGGVGGGVGFGAGTVLAAVAGSAAVAVAFPATVVAGSYAAARAIFRRQATKRRRELETLVHRLAEAVEDAARPAAIEDTGGPKAIDDSAGSGA